MPESGGLFVIDGEDAGSTPWEFTAVAAEAGNTFALDATNPNHETNAYRASFGGTNEQAYGRKVTGSNYTDVYFRGYVFIPTGASVASAWQQVSLFHLCDDNDVYYQARLCAQGNGDGLLYQWSFRTAGGTINSSNGTNFSLNAWHLIEIHWKAGSGTGGAQVWIDETLVFDDLTGTETGDVNYFLVGSYGTDVPVDEVDIDFDDIKADESYIGPYSAGGEQHELVGVVAGVAALNSMLVQKLIVAGSSGSIGSLIGLSRIKKVIAGSFAVSTSLNGLAYLKKVIAGIFSATTSFVGIPGRKRGIVGGFAVASVLTGTAYVKKIIQGSVTTASTLVAGLSLKKLLAGSFSVASTLAGVLIKSGQIVLQGLMAAGSSLTAKVHLKKIVKGSFATAATFIGTLTETGQVLLQGAIAAVSSLLGSIQSSKLLSSIINGEANISGALSLQSETGILDIDGAMLLKSDEPYHWFILNADDGATGVYDADDAIANDRFDTYDKCGFDTIKSALIHPWAVAYSDKPIWGKLEDIAEAILARSMGIDWSGTFRYRSRYEEEDGEDPSAIEDITDADVPDISSNIERKTHNHVVIRGAKIKKMTKQKLMWSAHGSSIGACTKSEIIQILDGALWPEPDEYTDEFIAKFKTGPIEDLHGWLQDISDHTMIGAKDVAPRIDVFDATGDWDDLSGSFTQIFFDILPEGVRIKYRNDAGETMHLVVYALYGKPIYKVGGKNAVNSGFIHDKFKDASDIRKNGEKTLTITNDFLIDKTQIEKVAEYHWRERQARHQYRQSLQGNRLYLLPGEWGNVEVGSAGYHEYLDYKGEFREIHWSWDAKGTERTDVIIDEQESNWKAQSNYSARFEEYGHPYKEPDAQSQAIVVASSISADIANMYCDGTSDETEINSAIDYLAALGGGTVLLTRGTFYIDGSIDMKSNVTLAGQGIGTIIEKNCNDHGIDISGGSGTELTSVRLANFKIQANAADTNVTKYLIYNEYSDGFIFDSIYMYNCYDNDIRITASEDGTIKNCTIDIVRAPNQYGAWIESNDTVIRSCIFKNCNGGGGGGIYVIGSRCTIDQNRAYNNYDGILLQAADCMVASNLCRDNSNDGINLGASFRNSVRGNQCYNNTVDGICIQDNSDDNVLGTNVCYNNGGRGIYILHATCDRNVLTGNRATGNTVANFTDNGTNTTDSGNDWN